tara:strand:+ start:42 stop:563 length:522 start_codon:yes stop_codon:yes gene_type:complete
MLGKIYLAVCLVATTYSWSCILAPEAEVNRTLFGGQYLAVNDKAPDLATIATIVATEWEESLDSFFQKVAQSKTLFHVVYGHGERWGLIDLKASYRRLSDQATTMKKVFIVVACRGKGAATDPVYRARKERFFREKKYPGLLFLAPRGHVLALGLNDAHWIKLVLWRQSLKKK